MSEFVAASLADKTNNIKFSIKEKDVIEFCGNGDIFVKGKLVENNKEVVTALKEFLSYHSHPDRPKPYWIKVDNDKSYSFADDSEFLCALKNKDGSHSYEVVRVIADGESMEFVIETAHGGEPTDLDWSDVDFYHLIKGEHPIVE
jgi:hypothetical protein